MVLAGMADRGATACVYETDLAALQQGWLAPHTLPFPPAVGALSLQQARLKDLAYCGSKWNCGV